MVTSQLPQGTPTFPLRCCSPSAYLVWAFNDEAPATYSESSPATVNVPPYPVGLRDFCSDCTPSWAKARGQRCLRQEVLAGRLEAPMRKWLRANFTMAGNLAISPIIKQEHPVETVNLMDYLGKPYEEMLRVWASGHDDEVVVFDLCAALAATELFSSRQVASTTFYNVLRESGAFTRKRSGVWAPSSAPSVTA